MKLSLPPPFDRLVPASEPAGDSGNPRSAAGSRGAAPAQRPKYVQRPDWLLRFALVGAFLLLAYAVAAAWTGVVAGNVAGRTFGIVACLLLAGVMLLGARRRTMSRGPGRAQDWVQFHVYGGVLFLLAVLCHSGFRLPRAGLTWWLLGLSVWLTASGLFGVLVRKWIPRALTSGLSHEVIYERIPELVEDLRGRAEALCQDGPAPLAELYRQRLARYFSRPRRQWIFLIDVSGGNRGPEREIRFLRPLLPAAQGPRVDELLSLTTAKRELDTHFTLQRLLRGWLAAHVPLAFLLTALVVAHVLIVLIF